MRTRDDAHMKQSKAHHNALRGESAQLPSIFCLGFVFFSCTTLHLFFFIPLCETYKAHSHLDLIHQPKAFIYESSHTFASELPPEVLMLNSQTTDSADHLSPKLIWVIIIFGGIYKITFHEGILNHRPFPRCYFQHARTDTHLFTYLVAWHCRLKHVSSCKSALAPFMDTSVNCLIAYQAQSLES